LGKRATASKKKKYFTTHHVRMNNVKSKKRSSPSPHKATPLLQLWLAGSSMIDAVKATCVTPNLVKNAVPQALATVVFI
jgi:hypothetical protein